SSIFFVSPDLCLLRLCSDFSGFGICSVLKLQYMPPGGVVKKVAPALRCRPMPQTLLVIDDEPQIRRVVRNAFKDNAARILEAATGAEGIDLAAAEHPDLVILDLGLPDVVGVDVCREIRKWSAAPILVLSARHS